MSEIYIFDLDGTLVDSMPFFTKGILSIPDEEGIVYGDDLIKILTPLGYTKSAEYYVRNFGIKDTVENIVRRIESRLIWEYSEHVKTKPRVLDYLSGLRERGARMFVLTASPHSVTDICLKKNGVYNWFEQVWSVEDFGLSKSDTRLFFEVAKRIGCEMGEVHYFDDSLIALKNAKAAGYQTYAVYDAQNDAEVAQMRSEYDFFVKSFGEIASNT